MRRKWVIFDRIAIGGGAVQTVNSLKAIFALWKGKISF
jgi:hypothetical protein